MPDDSNNLAVTPISIMVTGLDELKFGRRSPLLDCITALNAVIVSQPSPNPPKYFDIKEI